MKFSRYVRLRPWKTPKRPETVIKRALELVEDGEWVKGSYCEEIKPGEELGFCAAAALMVGAGYELNPEQFVDHRGEEQWNWRYGPPSNEAFEVYRDAYWMVAFAAHPELEDVDSGEYDKSYLDYYVQDMNDRPGTSRADIIAAFKAALEGETVGA